MDPNVYAIQPTVSQLSKDISIDNNGEYLSANIPGVSTVPRSDDFPVNSFDVQNALPQTGQSQQQIFLIQNADGQYELVIPESVSGSSFALSEQLQIPQGQSIVVCNQSQALLDQRDANYVTLYDGPTVSQVASQRQVVPFSDSIRLTKSEQHASQSFYTLENNSLQSPRMNSSSSQAYTSGNINDLSSNTVLLLSMPDDGSRQNGLTSNPGQYLMFRSDDIATTADGSTGLKNRQSNNALNEQSEVVGSAFAASSDGAVDMTGNVVADQSAVTLNSLAPNINLRQICSMLGIDDGNLGNPPLVVMNNAEGQSELGFLIPIGGGPPLDVSKFSGQGMEILSMDTEPAEAAVENPEVFKCLAEDCECVFRSQNQLTRHMKHHSIERPFKCPVCERCFKTRNALKNHTNTHTRTRPHKCDICDRPFTTSGELVRHKRYMHTFEKPHKCPECGYCSVELSKLRRHMRSHTGERPYPCQFCDYSSLDTYKLKRHMRTHTGDKPYECKECLQRFTQSNSLKSHMLIHQGNKPVYQCPYCPSTCGRKTDLRVHVKKLHTSDKPWPCPKCTMTFPDRYSMRVHVKTHEGEQCYHCNFCEYTASAKRLVEMHSLIHKEERPFICEFVDCGKAFRHPNQLRRHFNDKHNPEYVAPAPRDKPFSCRRCGKSFFHRGNLLRHATEHLLTAECALNEAITTKLATATGQKMTGLEEEDTEESSEESDVDEDDKDAAAVRQMNAEEIEALAQARFEELQHMRAEMESSLNQPVLPPSGKRGLKPISVRMQQHNNALEVIVTSTKDGGATATSAKRKEKVLLSRKVALEDGTEQVPAKYRPRRRKVLLPIRRADELGLTDISRVSRADDGTVVETSSTDTNTAATIIEEEDTPAAQSNTASAQDSVPVAGMTRQTLLQDLDDCFENVTASVSPLKSAVGPDVDELVAFFPADVVRETVAAAPTSSPAPSETFVSFDDDVALSGGTHFPNLPGLIFSRKPIKFRLDKDQEQSTAMFDFDPQLREEIERGGTFAIMDDQIEQGTTSEARTS